MGWGAGKCSQRGQAVRCACAAQRCNAERAERGAIFRSYRENVKRERDAKPTALQEPDWALERNLPKCVGRGMGRDGQAGRHAARLLG